MNGAPGYAAAVPSIYLIIKKDTYLFRFLVVIKSTCRMPLLPTNAYLSRPFIQIYSY